jgi:hypothetical protein
VDEESSAVALGDPDVFVEVDDFEKAGLSGKREWNSRELPPLEEGVDDRAHDLTDDDLSVRGLGEGIRRRIVLWKETKRMDEMEQ